MSDPIVVVIADDHPIVRRGIRDIIEEQPDMRVAAEAGDGAACVALIETHRPHIAVLDVDMPKLNGFAVAEELRRRNLAVSIIFLTILDEVDLLEKAMNLGKGYILKESALVEIVHGIRSVAAGRPYISPAMAASLLSHRSQKKAFENEKSGLDSLTPAERRILSLIAAGNETKSIADQLHVHPRTIETHRGNICHKLSLSGANALLRFALENRAKLLG